MLIAPVVHRLPHPNAAVLHKLIPPDASGRQLGVQARISQSPSDNVVRDGDHGLREIALRRRDAGNGSLAQPKHIAIRILEPGSTSRADLSDEVGGLWRLIFLEGHAV